jgi:hypothetical protein
MYTLYSKLQLLSIHASFPNRTGAPAAADALDHWSALEQFATSEDRVAKDGHGVASPVLAALT